MQHEESGGLRLALLGDPQITRDGRRVGGFVSGKAQALLAFMSVTGATHSREFVAGLFWAETPESDARASLRVVLSNLRQTIGAEHFTTTRNTVAFNRAAPYELDVETFEQCMATRDGTPDDTLRAWRRAVELYRGDLLSGVSVNDASAFDEWLAARREHLRQLAWRALYGLASASVERGELNASIDYLTRLLALDPWHEDAHRRLMSALLAAGRRNAALSQYEQCRQLLMDELGVEPEPATTALYERIRAGEASAAPVVAGNVSALPPQQSGGPLTSFVGRAGELANISTMLENPAYRLLTLVGPGGIGKSRLALQLVTDQRVRFPDGIYVVPLASISTSEHIAPAIAAALGTPLADGGGVDQLLRSLQTRQLLLVLDNLEHLSDSGRLLNDMLNVAPGVKILATSRERLALQAEWLMPVYGLPLPVDSTPERLCESSAVQLFVERARQARPDFVLDDDIADAVVHICRLLDGMPLPIELAAAWVRTHSCREIAASITENLDFLTTSLRDVPQRHRSLRAVFDHSWALLNEPERAIFAALSVFRSSFRQDAAETVTGAAPDDLLRLVDKSLLTRDRAGRYTLHELVRQYAHERLTASAELPVVQRRHAAHYAAFLRAGRTALTSERQSDTLIEIDTEIDNVRAAWSWAAAHGELDIIGEMLDGIMLFYDLWNRASEARTMVTDAIAAAEGIALGSSREQYDRKVLLGRMLGWRARIDMVLGRLDQAERELNEAQAILARHDVADLLQYGADTRGMLATARGRGAEARQLQQKALANARERGDHYGESLALSRLGGITYNAGNFREAKSWFSQSLSMRQRIGDHKGYGLDLINLGDVARLMGDLAEARRRLEDSLAWLRELAGQQREIAPLLNLGELHLSEGRFGVAEQYLQQALALGREANEQRFTPGALRAMAQLILLRDGDVVTAGALLEEALATVRAHGFGQSAARILNLKAHVAAHAEDWTAATLSAEEALELSLAIGNSYEAGRAETLLGRIATARQAHREAERRLDSALARLAPTGARPALLDALVSHAELLAVAPGQPPRHAAEWLYFALERSATWADTRTRARRVLAIYAEHLPPTCLTAASERAAGLTLDSALAMAAAR